MHYCFNKFFYLNMESNYRPNGLTSAPSWHETAILWFNPLLFYFPYLAVSLLSEHDSLTMEGNTWT